MGLRPQNDGGDDDDNRPTPNQTTILGLLHLKFFLFPHFFVLPPLTSLGQEPSSTRSLQPLFTEDDRAEGPVAGGAAKPVACATDEDAGPVADDIAEGPVAGGRCEACGLCWR